MAPPLRPKRRLTSSPPKLHSIYSHKVFIGGLQPRVTTNNLTHTFSRIGTVREISWPPNGKQDPEAPHQGYAFVIFETSHDVDALIKSASIVNGKLFVDVLYDHNKTHPAEIKLWKLADSAYHNKLLGFGYPIEAFIGGIRSGVTCVHIAQFLKHRYGEVTFIKLDTCHNRYPNGTGKIRFYDETALEKALVFNKLMIGGKNCEIKPFLSRETVKCSCDTPATELCLYCKSYLCVDCFNREHREHDIQYRDYIKNCFKANF